MPIYKGVVNPIPGEKGDDGPPNIISVGVVTTLPAGSDATVTMTGESPEQLINIGIPRGNDGADGADGNDGAPGTGLFPSEPIHQSVSFDTAYRPQDVTKPYRVSVMIDASYVIALAGVVSDTCELWIGEDSTVADSGGFKADSWRGSMTGILTLIGAGVGMRGQVEALVPAGWYFAVRHVNGNTATIPDAYYQLLT